MFTAEQYNAATQRIIADAHNAMDGMKLTVPYDIDDTVRKFRETFKNLELRAKIFRSPWEPWRISLGRYAAGFCIVASYTWAAAFSEPGKPSPWKIMYFSNQGDFGLHVWLQNRENGKKLDLTFDQFIDMDGVEMDVPYDAGRPYDKEIPRRSIQEFARLIGPEFADTIRRNMGAEI